MVFLHTQIFGIKKVSLIFVVVWRVPSPAFLENHQTSNLQPPLELDQLSERTCQKLSEITEENIQQVQEHEIFLILD